MIDEPDARIRSFSSPARRRRHVLSPERARARAEPGADAGSGRAAPRPSAPCPRRSSRRTRATSIPGRSRPASTRCSRPRASASGASCCSGRPIASRCAGWRCPGWRAFATPLGAVEIDRRAVEALRGLPQVVVSAQAHALEHSLEVHVPFLQAMLGDFTLVPLAVGHATQQEVAEVLERLWGGPGDADRGELRSLALPALRGRAGGGPRDRQGDTGARHRHLARAGVRRDAGDRPRARRAPARPQARADGPAEFRRHRGRPRTASSATARSPSTKRCAAHDTPIVLHLEYGLRRAADGRRAAAAGSRAGAAAARARRDRGRAGHCRAARATTCRGCKQQGACFVTSRVRASCAAASARCARTARSWRTCAANAVAAAFRDPRFKPLVAAELDAHRARDLGALRRSRRSSSPTSSDALRAAAAGHRRRRARVRPPHQHLPAAGLGKLHGPGRLSRRS